MRKVPPEVWLEIFKQVPQSSDLYGINAASHGFRDLSTRAFHRDLIWQNERHAEQDFDVWEANPGMAVDVRSLCLGIGGEPSNKTSEEIAAILNTGLPPHDLEGSVPYSRAFIASRSRSRLSDAQVVLWARVRTFRNISSLTFHNMTVCKGHLCLIHDLSQLRSLRVAGCKIDGTAADCVNNQTLPITELTMLALTRGHGARPRFGFPAGQIHLLHAVQLALGPGPAPLVPLPQLQMNQPLQIYDPFAHALSLAIAENLRTLTIDLSAGIFCHVFGAASAQDRGWVAPARLEHLYVLRDCTITAPKLEEEEPYQDAHLYNFCAQARNLRTISTPVFTPSAVALLPEDLPPRLEAFAAPLDAAQFVVAHRDVKALGVLKCELNQHEAVGALTLIAHARPGLKMLVFEVKVWDAAVVSAVSQRFKELRHLKFIYGSGAPDEDFLVSLSQYLAEMPDLHTLEMYRLPPDGKFKPEYRTHLFDPSWGSIEEEMRDIVVPWNKFGRKLRRVQLISGYALTRPFEGETWKLEKVAKLKRVEYLDY